MKQNPTMRSSSGEDDLTPSWSIGPTGSFLFENSSAHRIKDEITMNGGNHGQEPNTTFSSKVSRKLPETQAVKMKVGRLGCYFSSEEQVDR
jgi:hypothetical protein